MKTISLKNLLLLVLFTATMGFTACSDDDDDNDPTLAAPVLDNATAISNTGFTVNWTAVTGAENYLLDVSTAENFSSTVTGYSKLSIAGTATSHAVTGLTMNTKYYYRLYAKEGSLTSAASAVKDVTTTNTAVTTVVQ